MELIVENVHLQYRLITQENLSLRRKMVSLLTGGLMKKQQPLPATVNALNGISLKCKDGDRIAIIGHNGAGKSTLLKVIAGILTPNSGRIIRDARISMFLSLGFGMDVSSSGYDNIFLMGYLRNRTKEHSLSLVDKILDISELGDTIYRPVSSYSSGMVARLAFAINCCEEPEIFLVDEFLGTGDSKFLEKSTKIMHDLFDRSGILLFATHSEILASKLCNKFIVMENGCIVDQYDR